jgi:flagellar motor switch/type III secretory pathway protein FliN
MNTPQRISRLPRLEERNAELTNALLSLLASEIEDVRAESSASLHSGPGVFCAAEGISFQLLDNANNPLIENVQDVEAVCDALDAADPLLTKIEQQLHISLDPKSADAVADAKTDVVVISVADEDIVVKIVISTADERAADWIDRAANQSVKLETLPVRLRFELAGPRLALHEVEGFDHGDLMLLPVQISAGLDGGQIGRSVHPAGVFGGVFDLKTGNFLCQSAGSEEEQTSNMAINENEGGAFAGLKVPVSIRLPDHNIDAATLAALRPGGNLVLGPVIQGLQVILSVGGKEVARGEMVEIGDSFAVHIEERFGLTSAHGATVELGDA